MTETATTDASTSRGDRARCGRIRACDRRRSSPRSAASSTASPDAVRSALVCLLAEGHLLIEDVPGRRQDDAGAGARAHRCTRRSGASSSPRTCCPGDVTGVSVFNPLEREFEFKPGAIFANVVIADEINRSSPKTQSALLEAMEEQQVTVDGHSHPLPAPFLVVATQNPLEMEGTYALPEAQRDRFMMRISMGYPDARSEALMLRQRDSVNPLESHPRRRHGRGGLGPHRVGARRARRSRRSRTTRSRSPRRPAATPICGSARAPGRRCSWCVRRRCGPLSTAASSSSPTTSPRSSSPSSHTVSSPPARRAARGRGRVPTPSR